MSTPTREEFEARIEAVEARMDTRIASAIARLDAFEIRAEERQRRIEERLDERDKRLEERDKRLEMMAQQANAALQRTSNLTTHMWLTASAVIIAVVGTVVGAYYAAQSSHLGMTQAVISAFQQGQQMQNPLKE